MSTTKPVVPHGVTLLRVKTLHDRIGRISHRYYESARAKAEVSEPAAIKRMRKAVADFDRTRRAAADKASANARKRVDRLRYDVLFKTNSDEVLIAVEAFEKEVGNA